MQIDPNAALIFGAILTYIGGLATEKLRNRSSNETSATEMVTALFQRQERMETKLDNLKKAMDNISWRYFLSLRSLQDHRDVWPEAFIDSRPPLHKVTATDLANFPDIHIGEEKEDE